MTLRTLVPKPGICQAEYRAGFAGLRRCEKPAVDDGFCAKHAKVMRGGE